jgi:hypothetical protein
MGSHDPSAAQFAYWTMKIRLTKGQPSKDALRHGFCTAISLCASSEFHDGFIRDSGGFLRKKTHTHPALHRHKTLIRFVIPEQKRKKRGFSRPIGSDKSDAVSRVDLQRGFLKEDPPAK